MITLEETIRIRNDCGDTAATDLIALEDMLELTRRMTPSRNCFSRIAGAYMDTEGYVKG